MNDDTRYQVIELLLTLLDCATMSERLYERVEAMLDDLKSFD